MAFRMRYLPKLSFLPAALLLAAALLMVALRPGAAEETPLMDYGIDLVTSYVSDGEDQFVSAYNKEGKAHPAFPTTPAAQPYLNFYGPGGFSLGLWGSFALTNRAPEEDKGFDGLETLDEVDYTLTWAWENRLGAFTAGWATYTTPMVRAPAATNEVFFTVAPKFLEGIGGTLSHNVGVDTPDGGGTFTRFEIGGGEDFTWGFSLGQSVKLQDVSANVGYSFGALSISANVSYRPNPELVGYSEDGTYTVGSTTEDYPPAVFWLTISTGRSVAP